MCPITAFDEAGWVSVQCRAWHRAAVLGKRPPGTGQLPLPWGQSPLPDLHWASWSQTKPEGELAGDSSWGKVTGDQKKRQQQPNSRAP